MVAPPAGYAKGFPLAGKLREAVMRGNFKETNYRGFGSPSSVTHGFAARATFPAVGEGWGRRQPKASPRRGSCRLNGVKTTDEGIPYYCSLYDI